MNASSRRPRCDERDRYTDLLARNWACEVMIAIAEVLTAVLLWRRNPAWQGTLALLLIGAGTELLVKYHWEEERPWLIAGLPFLAAGAALLLRFIFGK